MKDLLKTNLFTSINSEIADVSDRILASKYVVLVAPADLEGVISLAQLEAALLDKSINYQRKLIPPRKHQVEFEDYMPKRMDGLTIMINPFRESQSKFDIEDHLISISPLSVEMKLETSNKTHHGSIECVALCAAIAHQTTPNGIRVRKLRHTAITGAWLRGGFETNYNPVYSLLRDHLNDEGSIDIRSLPEVKNPVIEMIPNFPERMLSRLAKGWDTMDFEQRSSAISELILPSLRSTELSTMMLEELVWHRLIAPGFEDDIASQLYIALNSWPEDVETAKLHGGKVADSLISKGHF